jgi:CheY-like chemotaxis protein
VEDEPFIRLALADVLTDEGHSVVECDNVLEAVAALGWYGDVAAVVTDVDMPGGLNGLDLARLLANVAPRVRVWVVSGRFVDPEQLAPGVVFLSKPYNFEALARDVTAGVGLADEFLPSAQSVA